MKILIAEDDPVSRKLLRNHMQNWGYDIVIAKDGKEAWKLLSEDDSINFAILDWMMPVMQGVEVCQKIRQRKDSDYVYVIMLTARDRQEDIVKGLDAGADDYVKKPFDPQELLSRIRVGERIIELESSLIHKMNQLQETLDHVKQLQGLLPICMHCKKIRDDKNCWHQMEVYVENHSDAHFSHGICEECFAKYYPEFDIGIESK